MISCLENKAPAARLRDALKRLDAGEITSAEVLAVLTPDEVHQLASPHVAAPGAPVAVGVSLAGGVGTGELVDVTALMVASRRPPFVVRCERITNDMLSRADSISAIVTTGEDSSSHAVIVARSLGLPVVRIDVAELDQVLPGAVTVDGTAGMVYAGVAGLVQPEWPRELHRLLDLAVGSSAVAIFANADQPSEIAHAVRVHGRGFEPRLEHLMITGSGLRSLRCALFATGAERDKHLDQLRTELVSALTRMYAATSGLPLYLRLLDPPEHEFVPPDHEVDDFAVALGVPAGTLRSQLAAAREVNPMMGCRGARLLLIKPDLVDVQVDAIFEALTSVPSAGPAHITLPMITDANEVIALRRLIAAAASRRPAAANLKVGVMIETPRAALLAHTLAPYVDYMCFGTNDLTAQTFGLSRGDVFDKFLTTYLREGIYQADPFAELDTAVRELIDICIERSRAANPDLTFTICGEQAADRRIIEFAFARGIDALAVPVGLIPAMTVAAAQHTFIKEVQP